MVFCISMENSTFTDCFQLNLKTLCLYHVALFFPFGCGLKRPPPPRAGLSFHSPLQRIVTKKVWLFGFTQIYFYLLLFRMQSAVFFWCK